MKTLTSGGVATDWLWDGDRLVAEYNSSGTLTARYLHGTGPDEPLAQVAGTRRWFLADTQGSIIAETDSGGALADNAITYDPYGQPGSWTGPRFGYTGQMRLVPSVPLWHYKARAYDPRIGRFLQTDPIGYDDSLNLYAYVGNDPVNLADPTGMKFMDGWADLELGAGLQSGQDRPRRDDRAEQATSHMADAVGAAGNAAQAVADTPYGRGLGVASTVGTVAVESAAGYADVENGAATVDEAVVHRGGRATGAVAGGAIGAGLGGALCSPSTIGAAACAAVGGYAGSRLGTAVGSVADPLYRGAKREVNEWLSDFNRGFDDYISRYTGGYRPQGTR